MYVTLTFETKIHRLEWFAQVILISATTMSQKFEDRSQEETEWQERCAREAAWRLTTCILKLKEKNETTFFSPSENWCLPAPSTLKPEEREFVVDSGASIHMISKKDLNSDELETVTTSISPMTVVTANGEEQTKEEATVYVKELDIFLTMKVLENTPAVSSLGKLYDEHGYSYEWINGQKSHLIKTVFGYSATQRTSYQSWFLVCQRVLPQACFLHYSWHLQGRKLIIPNLPQARLSHQPWHHDIFNGDWSFWSPSSNRFKRKCG